MSTFSRGAALILVLGLLMRVAACGGGEVSADDSQGEPALVAEVHSLVVEVDGARYEARGLPSGPVIRLGQREVQVRVGGALVGLAPGPVNSPGPIEDLILVLLANDVRPGEYPLRSSAVAVEAIGEPAGFAQLEFPNSIPLGVLTARSGQITLRTVDGVEDGQRYRLGRVEGSIAGVFTDRSAAEHSVTAEFTYVP
ncbi:MAG: hypothetical protein AAGG01_03120 [Planctomycetota bacterium]